MMDFKLINEKKMFFFNILNKCSAVAEMGNCLATIDIRQKVWRLLCPFLLGELGLDLIQCLLSSGLPPYHVAS